MHCPAEIWGKCKLGEIENPGQLEMDCEMWITPFVL